MASVFAEGLAIKGKYEFRGYHLQKYRDQGMSEQEILIARRRGIIKPVHYDVGQNIVVYEGRSALLSRLFSSATTYALFTTANTFIAVGDSNTAAAETQTDIQAVTNRHFEAVDSVTVNESTSVNPTAVIVGTLETGDANFNIWEVGLFNANSAASGNMFSRFVRAAAFPKDNTTTLEITVTVSLQTPS